MQVKSIAECSKGEHSAILLTFIKLPFAIKIFVLSIFVLSIFEWPFYTGFNVLSYFWSPSKCSNPTENNKIQVLFKA